MAEPQLGRRTWRDLSKRRLFLGLAFAPVLPVVLGACLLLMLGGGLIFGSSLVFTVPGAILAAAEIWSMLIGTIFLVVARWRGTIRRAHCVLLGAFLAFSLPSATFVTSKAVDRISGIAAPTEDEAFFTSLHGPSDGTFIFVLGLLLIPFGTLGGWIFWRVGAYPARPKIIDAAAVFD